MKAFRRVIALSLSIAMIIACVFTSAVFADEITFTDVASDYQFNEAIYSLVADGIINGYTEEDGTSTFKPENTITRAEFAKLLSLASAKGVTLTATTDKFPDVASDHWANVYIAAAIGTGAVNGYEDGTFRPENPVSYGEAIKMIVCTLGYGKIVAATEPWYTGYINIASSIGLTKNAAGLGTNEASRGLVAQLIYNISSAKTLVQTGTDSSGRPVYSTGDDDYEEESGVVTAVFERGLEGDTSNLNKQQIMIGSATYYIGEYSIDTLYSYLGKSVDIKYDDGSKKTILSITPTAKNSTLTINDMDLGDISGRKLKYYDSDNDEKELTLASDIYVVYNGVGVPRSDIDSEFINKYFNVSCGEITFLNNDSNSDYDVAFITSYDTYYVTSVQTTDTGVKVFDTYGSVKELELSTNNTNLYKVTSKGGSKTASDSLSAITAKSVLSVAAPITGSDMTVEAVVSTAKVSSARIASKSSGYDDVFVGSNYDEYDVSDYFLDLVNTNESEYGFDTDETGTLYLDFKGRIVYFSKTESSDPYAYLVKFGTGSGSSLGGNYKIQLYTQSGSLQEYSLKDSSVKVNGVKLSASEAASALRASAAVINSGKDADIIQNAEYSQLVKYKTSTSGGVTYVSDIYTINAEDTTTGNIIPGTFKADSSAEKAPFFTGGKLSYYTSGKTFRDSSSSNQFGINTSTIVFFIPDDRNDTDDYKKRTSSTFSDGVKYAVEPYDMTSTIAKVVLVYACGSSSMAVINTSDKCIFIESITSATNSSGESVAKVTFYNAGDKDNPTTLYTDKKAKSAFDDISAGDIVRISKENGEIAGVQKVFVGGVLYDYKSGDVYNTFEAEGSYINHANGSNKDYYQVIHGIVYSADIENGSFSVVPGVDPDAYSEDWIGFNINSSTVYYEWNSSSKKYNITTGDAILAATDSNPNDASKVVAISMDNKVTAVYILK